MITAVDRNDLEMAEPWTAEYNLQMRLLCIHNFCCAIQHLTPEDECTAKHIDGMVREVFKFKTTKQYPRDRDQMTGPEIAAAAVADLDGEE